MNNTVISNNNHNSVFSHVKDVSKQKILRPALYSLTVPISAAAGVVIGGTFTLLTNSSIGIYGLFTGICHLRMDTKISPKGMIFFNNGGPPFCPQGWHKKWGIKDGMKMIIDIPVETIKNGYELGAIFSQKNIDLVTNLTQ